jgi:phosphoribosylglycinamide formyltransferase 1
MLNSWAFVRRHVKKLAILISGRGSNMASLARACEAGRCPARVVAVIASRADSPGVALARELGLRVEVMPPAAHADRAAYDEALEQRLEAMEVDLVALAGFMRILGDGFVKRFDGRLVNIHPSLLPCFPGLDTHARALAAGVRVHGATVHLVTPTLDHGPILAQAVVSVRSDDDPASLGARVLRAEHRLYPAVVQWILEDRVRVSDGRVTIEGVEDSARLMWEVA